MLERRTLLASVTWNGAGDGRSWSDGANWLGGVVPASGDDVTITSATQIDINSIAVTVRNLSSNSTLIVGTGGGLTIQGVVGGNGAIRGTITTQAGARFSGGTLDGVTVNGDFEVSQNGQVNVVNGLTLNGTATVGGSDNSHGVLNFQGTQTLGGNGAVVFGGDNVSNTLRQETAGATLTIGAGITVRGKTGYIGYNPNRGGNAGVHVVNQGTLRADAVGSNIRLQATSLTSPGSVVVDATRSMTIATAIANVANTLPVSGGGTLIVSGSVSGGTLSITGGTRVILSGSTLSGLTVNGDFEVSQNGQVNVVNGLTLNGTATVGGSDNSHGVLNFQGTQTLGGNGTVVFGGDNASNTLRQETDGATLTIGAGITVRGKTGYIGYNPNRGGNAGVNVVNQGTIVRSFGSSLSIPTGLRNSCHILETKGESYRLQDAKRRRKGT